MYLFLACRSFALVCNRNCASARRLLTAGDLENNFHRRAAASFSAANGLSLSLLCVRVCICVCDRTTFS